MQMRRIVAGLVAWLTMALPLSAGNGSWTQVDGWAGGFQWVTNIERGNWHMGMSGGLDDDEWWTGAAVMRTWAVGRPSAPWKLRAGVAARAEQIPRWTMQRYDLAHCWSTGPDDCGALRFGVRLSVDRWAEYGQWGTFLMGEWTSIDNTKLAVAGLTYLPSGISGQLSLWHEDDGEVTPTVMLSVPVTKRISVRLGHKFIEDETFIGFSFSTY